MPLQPHGYQNPGLKENHDFFQTLYTEHHQPVFHTALRYLHNPEDAADVTNDTFVALMINPSAIRQLRAGNASLYLRGIARNLALTLLRRRKAEEQACRRMAERAHTHHVLNAGAQYLVRCTLQDVWQALSLLPPRDAEVLRMHIFSHLSCSEISALLHLQDTSVRTRLNRARKRLRQVMDAIPPNPAESPAGRCAK